MRFNGSGGLIEKHLSVVQHLLVVTLRLLRSGADRTIHSGEQRVRFRSRPRYLYRSGVSQPRNRPSLCFF
jgi:hypothetical protein